MELARQIAQFYSRYPLSSLTTELVTVHSDAYVVRAIAHVGSAVLATAMATHHDLEQAEDRAKARVLESIAVDLPREFDGAAEVPDSLPQDLGSATHPTADLTPKSTDAPVLPSAPGRATVSPNSVPADVLTSEGQPFTNPPPSDVTIPGLDRDISPAATPPSAASSSAPPAAIPPRKIQRSDRESVNPPRKPAPAETILAPQDLSDIIAKTSVELRRLGWTDEQGRDHLQAAYGKRSRQHLTDPELVDFLRYLEQQPSPKGRQ